MLFYIGAETDWEGLKNNFGVGLVRTKIVFKMHPQITLLDRTNSIL